MLQFRFIAISGSSWSGTSIKQVLRSAVREKVVRAGGDPDSKLTRISKTTLRNYESLFPSKLNYGFWKEWRRDWRDRPPLFVWYPACFPSVGLGRRGRVMSAARRNLPRSSMFWGHSDTIDSTIFLPSVILDATERVTTLEHQMREMEEHSLLQSTKIKDLETYIDATRHDTIQWD